MRFHLDKSNKTVFKVSAGPSFMLFANVSNYNAKVDFGGIYQVDTSQRNAITYYDYFNPASKHNIFFTSESINSRNQTTSANRVFEQLVKAYDFANDKNYRDKQNFSRVAVAFNVDVHAQHKISEGLTVQGGVHIVYAPSLAAKENYTPVDKTSDPYQSVYNSNSKAMYRASGVNIWICIQLLIVHFHLRQIIFHAASGKLSNNNIFQQ